jgi:uncharacterized protein YprB with RNaseH-like and TPR domain/predicted nuclease with RNAse H fold
VLNATFLHLPGVGRRTEAKFWEGGIASWDRLTEALRSDVTSRARTPSAGRHAASLPVPAAGSGRALWLDQLDEAREAFAKGEFEYFARRLPTSEHWRILPDALENALFLDIETTGLSRDLHALTIVGALYKGRFHQWAWPEGASRLREMLATAAVVVTFNGARFDLPFLQKHLPDLPSPRLHVDLRSVATRAGLSGGLKAVEEALGLSRNASIRGLRGEDAVALWCRALYGDRAAYQQLLEYNRADVINLRVVAEKLIVRLAKTHGPRRPRAKRRVPPKPADKKRAISFRAVIAAWRERHMTVEKLLPAMPQYPMRAPVIVGVDLRGKAHNPTGLAACTGGRVTHGIAFEDDAIFEWIMRQSPDLVSIDAPLSLPRGRASAFDDDPARPQCGIVRDAERILWSRGIRVYPALIKHMQGLTSRGIALAARLQSIGVEVIESYPGAAQDVLGIPRKGVGLSLLHRGLCDFGFDVPSGLSHDELDAVTSALVGYFYLADRYEGLGARDENYLIVPRPDTMRWSDAAASKSA